MKILNKPRFLLMTLTLSLFLFIGFTTFSAYASPSELVINTGNTTLGKVYYDNFSIIAKKITFDSGIGYCLEIDKNYPHGENFINKSTVNNNIENIIACGYPIKSLNYLGLKSEDDAYFATQLAIWSSIEGYDVNKITGDRPEILTAIKSIYNNSLTIKNNILDYDVNLFFSKASIQDIVILSSKTNPNPTTPPDEKPIIPEIIPPIPDDLVTPPVIDDNPIINGK